jgi:hypothetical protein
MHFHQWNAATSSRCTAAQRRHGRLPSAHNRWIVVTQSRGNSKVISPEVIGYPELQ